MESTPTDQEAATLPPGTMAELLFHIHNVGCSSLETCGLSIPCGREGDSATRGCVCEGTHITLSLISTDGTDGKGTIPAGLKYHEDFWVWTVLCQEPS